MEIKICGQIIFNSWSSWSASWHVIHAANSSRSVFASRYPRRRREDSRCKTHRAEETGATWKTRRPATSESAGSKVKTIAYNWHMKFKGGVACRAGGKAGGSLNIPAVFEPLFFSRPSASLEIYISSLLCWNCLFIPLSFKESLVAMLPLSYSHTPILP